MPEESPSATARSRGTLWIRVLVVGSAVLAILLLGAAIGMVARLPGMSSSSDAAVPSAESVDVGFAYDMVVHHRQAVSMANWVRDHGSDPEVRNLAFDIEQTQLGQIGRMEGWTSLWGYPEDRPLDKPFMTWIPADLAGMSHTHTSAGMTTMPGMASKDELDKLRDLKGSELDIYFLQLMLRHHQGGAPMARYAAEHATQPAVRALAANMLDSQGHEIDQMKRDLTTRNAQPLPN
jgi:uncharacterized protein (DUF305 family)